MYPYPVETKATVRVPASTANLGPAFDCLALALDVWNETEFELAGAKLSIEIRGEGEMHLPRNEKNLVYRAFKRACDEVSEPLPGSLAIRSRNSIPLSSGLGSSAAASLAGLLGANALLGGPLNPDLILQLGAELEGHADNFAAAQLGGLVLVTKPDWRFAARRLECAPLHAVYVLPEVRLSTKEARRALPQQVPLADAVFNIGASLQVAEALRSGDLAALAAAMHDKLHQPYRLPLIPGAAEALQAARQAGAAAGLSGAGPGLIAFVAPGREDAIAAALQAPFTARQVATRVFKLKSTPQGASAD
jgi:homoserine kinase